MADSRPASSEDRRPFRWQALFQHSPDAFFLLNHQRRILHVNPAWETATDIPLADARGLVCRRRSGTESTALDAIAAALAPPPEVLEGRPARVRRRVAGVKRTPLWWDIDFSPFRDGKGRLRVLGKLSVAEVEEVPRVPPLPERLVQLRERLEPRYGFDSLASEVLTMRRVAEQARLASQSRTPVLIVGEAGVGKEGVARVIHHQGLHRERHFAAVDCAALPADALEQVLVGGAGLLTMPGLGTLYLREVSRLPRDLQERVVERLLDASTPTGPRLIGSTVDPAGEVQSQRLLDRLHIALSTLVIQVPPLRERRADLPHLIDQVLARLNAIGIKRVESINPAARTMLTEHDWPGNLTELNQVLASAWRRTEGTAIDTAQLPRYLRQKQAVAEEAAVQASRGLPLAKILEEVERRLLLVALKECKGNKTRAAKLLDIWRPQMLRRMEKLGISEKSN
jgi:transcriptional regulator with PAS, ATPase and Fis domain